MGGWWEERVGGTVAEGDSDGGQCMYNHIHTLHIHMQQAHPHTPDTCTHTHEHILAHAVNWKIFKLTIRKKIR